MKACPLCFKNLDEGLSIWEYVFKEDVICGKCRSKFIENRRIYTYKNLNIKAFYLYDEFLESLLFQYKEARDVALADIFLWKKKEEMVDIIRQDSCIPMPSAASKIKERGFDHMEKMLTCCSLKIEKCLEKDGTYKQSLQRGKNRQNIRKVMKLKKRPEGKFILFDDVVTSGNTLISAANLLCEKDEIVQAVVLSVHPHFVEICDKEQL